MQITGNVSRKNIIGLTLGDVAGIGPEIVVKALTSRGLTNKPIVVFGSLGILIKALGKFVNQEVKDWSINLVDDQRFLDFRKGKINLVNVNNIKLKRIGMVDKAYGRAAYEYIVKAIDWANKGLIKGIVTAPISKEALNYAGINFKGHTQILAKRTNTSSYAMSFFSPKLKVILATTHIPLKRIWSKLSPSRLEEVIMLAQKILLRYGIKKPHLAIAGLNPHAGESGILGMEEEELIRPVLKSVRKKGIWIDGPYPPDTIYLRALKGEFDMVVALYHDQGLIPMKLIDFNKCVNLTCGLPFIRTSPSHGTAFDIAWKGKADPASMIEAVKLAYYFGKRK